MFLEDPNTWFIVAYSMLAASMATVTTIMVLNYKAKDETTVPYSKITKEYLDEYFDKVNQIYAKRGLQWKVSPGHYWIELSIDTTLKRNQKNMIYAAPGILRSSVVGSIEPSPDKEQTAAQNSIT